MTTQMKFKVFRKLYGAVRVRMGLADDFTEDNVENSIRMTGDGGMVELLDGESYHLLAGRRGDVANLTITRMGDGKPDLILIVQASIPTKTVVLRMSKDTRDGGAAKPKRLIKALGGKPPAVDYKAEAKRLNDLLTAVTEAVEPPLRNNVWAGSLADAVRATGERALAAEAEVGRLKTILRVNLLRYVRGATHEGITKLLAEGDFVPGDPDPALPAPGSADEALLGDLNAYLQTSRAGGMSDEQSEFVATTVTDFLRHRRLDKEILAAHPPEA